MRLRVILPVSLGLVAVALMVWDLLNERVIQSMGMVWDTGAPAWPYQTARLLLVTINAPAFVLASPFFLLPHMELVLARYATLLPLILLWWWWVGTRIDLGVLGHRHFRRPRLAAILVSALGAGLLCLGINAIFDVIHFWLKYPGANLLLFFARQAGLIVWSFALTGACVLAALRLRQRRFPMADEQRPRSWMPVVGLGFAALVAVAASLVGIARAPGVDPDSCTATPKSGCVHGTIADAHGRPIAGMQIEILPADNRDDGRWPSFRYEWTDAEGRYNANDLEPGTYLLATNWYHAPVASRPYATTFYPGAETEGAAECVVVTPNSRVILKQLRLRSLPLVEITVEVTWAGGVKPQRSHIIFDNLNYLHGAPIGDVPQIDDGRGAITLPVGFDYTAQARVDCDSGRVIEFRDSPSHAFTARAGSTPPKLTFVIPGSPCKLWDP